MVALPKRLQDPLRERAWRHRRSMAAELASILECALQIHSQPADDAGEIADRGDSVPRRPR